MANMKQIPGKPGEFRVTTAEGSKTVKLVEWREDYVYDTIEVAAGAAALGQQYLFFVSTTGPAGAPKLKCDTNIRTARRLSSGQEMILNQIGVGVQHNRWTAGIATSEVSNVDACWAIERLHYILEINQITMAEGPVGAFPPGWGCVGVADLGVGAGAGFVNNGVASPAAVPRLLVPQNIYSENDISGTLTHHAAGWTVTGYTAPAIGIGGMSIKNTLRGYIKTAVGKG
jgi:hypothetical protein